MPISNPGGLGGAGSVPIVGAVQHLMFDLTGNIWTDPGGYLWLTIRGQTIGAPASTAQVALVQLRRLYAQLWAVSNYQVNPVRGSSAAADWEAGKQLTLPNASGRGLIGSGTGPNLTARQIGQRLGGESLTLAVANLPFYDLTGATFPGSPHGHFGTISAAPDHAHQYLRDVASVPAGSGGMTGTVINTGRQIWTGAGGAHSHTLSMDLESSHWHNIQVNSGGSGTPVPSMPPSLVCCYVLATGELS